MSTPWTKTEPVVEKLFEWGSFPYLLLDQKGKIHRANPFLKRLTGEELVKRSFTDLLETFQSEFDFESFLCRSRSEAVLLNLKRKDGLPETFFFHSLAVEGMIHAFGHVDSEELLAVRKEILSLNREMSSLTRELHKKNAQLETLNQEKNRFLGMAAHDLRKPIGLIMSYSDFIIEETSEQLSEEHAGFLQTIKKTSTFMKRIVDDFLDVSVIEAGMLELHRQRIPMATALDASLRINELQATRKGIELVVHVGSDLPAISIDTAKIDQVVTNLVSNAIEHSDSGSQVSVRLDQEENRIRFAVQDWGPGIAAEDLKRIFQAYGRAKTRKTAGEKSVGLGMLIAKKIIEAHGGTLWIESDLGKGTTVHFALPIEARK